MSSFSKLMFKTDKNSNTFGSFQLYEWDVYSESSNLLKDNINQFNINLYRYYVPSIIRNMRKFQEIYQV